MTDSSEKTQLTSNERYIIVAGGDGYATVTVDGRDAMERAFVRAHWPSVNFDQPLSEEEQQTYDFVRDEDQWECDLRNGRECLQVSYEDGWVSVFRITDTLAWAKGPTAHETLTCAWTRSDRGDGHLSAFIKTECGASFHIPPGIDKDHKFCGNCGKPTAQKAGEPR